MDATTSRSKLLGSGWRLALSLIMVIGYGCASGRAMTDTETSEYEALEQKLNVKRSSIESKERQLRKAFSKASIGTSGNKARLCGLKNDKYITGKVPLVYGAKKRVTFSARGDGTLCRDARIEVKK
jgi:hypothetical protein